MGDIRRARYCASRAESFARERGEGHTSMEAEAFIIALDQAEANKQDAAEPHTPRNVPGVEAEILAVLQHLRAVAA
jgi:hypothetical protein